MNNLSLKYENMKKIILIFLVLIVINYSFNSIFNYTYLLPLNLACLIGVYLLIHFLFPQRFQLIKEDMIMILIVLYCLFHSLFLGTYEYTLLVLGMSFAPYFFSRFIILEDKDVDFFIGTFYILGTILLIVYFQKFGFKAVEGRMRIDGRHPVAIAADFGLVAVIFSYVFFTAKEYWLKFLSLLLLIATFYITVFILATRGASFTAMLAIVYLYYMLSKGTIKDKVKRFIFISIFVGIFIFIIHNNLFIERYPMLERFTLKGILNDPSVTGDRRFTGRKWFAIRSFEIILRSTFFGEGLGVIYSHNIFLEWVASLGFVGLLPFLTLLFLVFMKGFRFRKLNPRFALFFTMLIYSFLLRIVSFSMISHKSFFVICGLMLSYYYTLKKYEIKN